MTFKKDDWSTNDRDVIETFLVDKIEFDCVLESLNISQKTMVRRINKKDIPVFLVNEKKWIFKADIERIANIQLRKRVKKQ